MTGPLLTIAAERQADLSVVFPASATRAGAAMRRRTRRVRAALVRPRTSLHGAGPASPLANSILRSAWVSAPWPDTTGLGR
jgi:hypothetical protein